MRAVVCSELSGPASLQVQEVPRPVAGAGQVMIEARAWGLNFADVLMSHGKYQTRPALPFVSGCEVAGVIAEVGPGVDRFEVGARVAALAPGGGFAEWVAVDAHKVLPLSDRMDFATGAGFFASYATALHGLKQRGQLCKGETLLVLAAGGGTGAAAVDVGTALGAQVIAVAGSAEKLAFAARRGARLINYRQTDVPEEIRRLTAGQDVDVVFDPVGGDLFDGVCRRVRWNGRYLVVGFASGRVPALPVNLCLVKGYSLVGVFTDEFMRRAPEESSSNAHLLNQLFDAGRLLPNIVTADGIGSISRMLLEVQQGTVTGKAVVRLT